MRSPITPSGLKPADGFGGLRDIAAHALYGLAGAKGKEQEQGKDADHGGPRLGIICAPSISRNQAGRKSQTQPAAPQHLQIRRQHHFQPLLGFAQLVHRIDLGLFARA